jgi:hypothetical protein
MDTTNPELDRLISRALTLATHLVLDGVLARHNFNRFVSLCDALGVSPEEMVEVAHETLASA